MKFIQQLTKGWMGISNGKLLELLADNKFDALLTFDKNLQDQQNFSKYTIAVIVLNAPDNSYITLKGLVDKVRLVLTSNLAVGPIEVSCKRKVISSSHSPSPHQ